MKKLVIILSVIAVMLFLNAGNSFSSDGDAVVGIMGLFEKGVGAIAGAVKGKPEPFPKETKENYQKTFASDKGVKMKFGDYLGNLPIRNDYMIWVYEAKIDGKNADLIFLWANYTQTGWTHVTVHYVMEADKDRYQQEAKRFSDAASFFTGIFQRFYGYNLAVSPGAKPPTTSVFNNRACELLVFSTDTITKDGYALPAAAIAPTKIDNVNDYVSQNVKQRLITIAKASNVSVQFGKFQENAHVSDLFLSRYAGTFNAKQAWHVVIYKKCSDEVYRLYDCQIFNPEDGEFSGLQTAIDGGTASTLKWYGDRVVQWGGEPLAQAAPPVPAKEENPLDILKKRYAKGEITKEQFDQMKEDLK